MATTSTIGAGMLPVPGGQIHYELRPDLAALKGCPCRIVPAAGTGSTGQLAHEGGLGPARAPGVEAAVFPGDHGGFDGRPAEFAARLLEVLEGGRS